MRIGLGSPDRSGVTAKQAKSRPGVGVKGATPVMKGAGKDSKMVAAPLGADPMCNSSGPQADFGKTGTGDPKGSYGSNANVKGGKYHGK
jgi:hypothetical protein